jgi:hypothetical protein
MRAPVPSLALAFATGLAAFGALIVPPRRGLGGICTLSALLVLLPLVPTVAAILLACLLACQRSGQHT